MFKIFKAEFRRTFRHRSNLIFIGIAVLFTLLLLSVSLVSILDENTARALEYYQKTLSFPISIINSISLSFIFFLLLTPAITASFIGSDYQSDTWKMILPRTPQRGTLLAAKLINLAVYLIFLLLIATLLVHICSLFGMFWLKASFINRSWEIPLEKQSSVISIIVFVIWYASVSTLMTIMFRSVFIGTLTTYGVLIFFVVINHYSSQHISVWFPIIHFWNLFPLPQANAPVYDGSRPDFPILMSWIIITLYITGSLISSCLVLKRQEFDGS